MSKATKIRRKENPLTPSQILFEGKKILTSRPEEMTTEEYRTLRKYQTEVIKMLHRKSPNRKIANLMPIRRGYNG